MFESGRTPEHIEHQFAVYFGKWFARNFSSYYHNLDILNRCPIPPKGPAIIACNHTSGMDPLYIQSACPRVITWLMAAEYGPTFGLQWFFRAIEPILVERSGKDMAATRSALRALKNGKILGLFPEGRISKTDDLLEFQTGVALLAIKAKVPVYPAYLDGTQRGKSMIEGFLRPNHSTLMFGPAVSFEDVPDGREGLDVATQRIFDAILDLRRKTRGGPAVQVVAPPASAPAPGPAPSAQLPPPPGVASSASPA